MTIINSSLFFVSTFIFACSIKTIFKEKKEIIFILTIKLKKYQNIRLDESLLNYSPNIHKFKKEFWDKFSNYKDQIKEELVKDQYIFVNPKEKKEEIDMNKVFKNIQDKVEKINGNMIIMKRSNSITWFNTNDELRNFNFFDYFQPLYKITIPNDIINDIEDLAKTYFINFDFKLLDSKKSSKNKKTIYFFSLKENKISLLQDFDNTRLKRVYYFRFKTFDLDFIKIKTGINNLFSQKLKLTPLNDSYYYNNYKKTLALKFYDPSRVADDKREKMLFKNNIKDLFESKDSDEFKDLSKQINYEIKCEKFLEYETESEEENEQILIKAFNSNYLVNKFYNPRWVNKFDKKVNKKGNKETIKNQETIKKVYYVRLKMNSNKGFDLNIVKQINNILSKLKLTLLNNCYYYNNYKKTLAFEFYDQSHVGVGNNKTQKISHLIKKHIKNGKIKFQSFFEYQKEKEKGEEILLKNFVYSNNKDDKKEEKDNEWDTNKYKPLHKVIIVTDRLGQDFKEKIFNFIGFENILNFNEKIYLSESSFWNYLKEKHSFQFIVKNNFFGVNKNLKSFKDFISKYQYFYNKYDFNDKKNKVNYQIIPINPLEDWDNPNNNKPNNNENSNSKTMQI